MLGNGFQRRAQHTGPFSVGNVETTILGHRLKEENPQSLLVDVNEMMKTKQNKAKQKLGEKTQSVIFKEILKIYPFIQ